MRRRIRRWMGLCSLASRRTIGRAVTIAPRRLIASIGGVALAIALLLLVTGLSIGIAADTTAYSEDVDYWITPETDGASSALVSPDAPMFGNVHDASTQINAIDGVEHATPVLARAVPVRTTDDRRERLLVVGVIASPEGEQISGLPTAELTPGDPHYADGEYSGTWTGEAVVSTAAATALDVDEGAELTVDAGSDAEPQFTATSIESVDGPSPPAILVQLSEFQQVVGAADGDRADQHLVITSDPAVESQLETIYPQSTVQTRADLTTSRAADQQLPLAMIVTALVVAIIVGVLFTMTTMGMELAADEDQLVTLSALGFSSRSILGLVTAQTLVLTTLGGIAGGGLAAIGTRVVNALTTRLVGVAPVAPFEPIMMVAGVGTAVVIGVLSTPYLAIVLRALGVTRGGGPR